MSDEKITAPFERYTHEELLHAVNNMGTLKRGYAAQLATECLRRLMKHLIDTEQDHEPTE